MNKMTRTSTVAKRFHLFFIAGLIATLVLVAGPLSLSAGGEADLHCYYSRTAE